MQAACAVMPSANQIGRVPALTGCGSEQQTALIRYCTTKIRASFAGASPHDCRAINLLPSVGKHACGPMGFIHSAGNGSAQVEISLLESRTCVNSQKNKQISRGRSSIERRSRKVTDLLFRELFDSADQFRRPDRFRVRFSDFQTMVGFSD